MTKRQQFKRLHRQYRIAHNQISIMSVNGVLERIKTTTKLRDFCGKWTVPEMRSGNSAMMFYRRGWGYQKMAYLPWASFSRWMKRN